MTHVPELMALPAAELLANARARGVELRPHLQKHELVGAIAAHALQNGDAVTTEGVLAVLPEGFGFVRLDDDDLRPGDADAFVSPSQVRALNLQTGHRVRGPIRAPKGNERFFALLQVDRVQGADAKRAADVLHFDAHETFAPTRPWELAVGDDDPAALRELATLRRGHRALLEARGEARVPPELLAGLAARLRARDADVTLCLLDQRPEDVAAARARVAGSGARVLATPFADDPERHAQLADMAWNAALRQVERGRDAVLLLDSLTALTRAVGRSAPASGRWACPGLDAAALRPAARVFASARQLSDGGSMTVIATVTVRADSVIDRAIADEFRPAANLVATVAS